MANVQKENGFTGIANEILEQICEQKLNGTQLRIIIVIWRYTYGFHRSEHNLSASFICKALKSDLRTIKREINKLIDMNLIIVKASADFCNSRILAFNKDYDTWLNKPQEVECPPGSSKPTITGGETPTKRGGQMPTQEINKNNNKYKNNVCEENQLKEDFNIIYNIYPRKGSEYMAYKNYKEWINGRCIGGRKIKLSNRQIYLAVCNYNNEKSEANTDIKYYKSFANLMGEELINYVDKEEEKV